MRNFITPIGEEYPFGGPGKFILGTVQAMAEQLRQEYANTVDLIYIDPPFGTGDGFSVKLPGVREKVKIPAYSDSMDTASYLEMMRGVLTLCHDLLKDTGSIYVHIDYRMCARIRLMLDEVFGESCFQNEIIWAYKSGGRSVRHYSRKHDNILFYRKSAKAYFDISTVGVPRGPMKRNNMKRTVDENGKLCFSIRSGGKTYTSMRIRRFTRPTFGRTLSTCISATRSAPATPRRSRRRCSGALYPPPAPKAGLLPICSAAAAQPLQ